MNPPKQQPRRVYAKRGEWIVCERGHKIARFAKTVYYGEEQQAPLELERWTQAPPKDGTPSTEIKCTLQHDRGQGVCGADWFASDGSHHFKDGWR